MEANNYYKYKFKRPAGQNLKGTGSKSNELEETEDQNEDSGKENVKRALKELGKDVALGVLAGGLGAAVFGRYSFYAGAVISGYGHYSENKALSTLGLGMMSSSSMTAAQGVKQDPKAPLMANVQERVKAFGQELQRKLLLSKISPATETDPQEDLDGIKQRKSIKPVTDTGKNISSAPAVKPDQLEPIADLWSEIKQKEKAEQKPEGEPQQENNADGYDDDPLGINMIQRIL